MQSMQKLVNVQEVANTMRDMSKEMMKVNTFSIHLEVQTPGKLVE